MSLPSKPYYPVFDDDTVLETVYLEVIWTPRPCWSQEVWYPAVLEVLAPDEVIPVSSTTI